MDRFSRNFHSKERVRFIAALPCVVCGLRPCQNAHVKSRGAGGGYQSIVPLCPFHHQEQGQLGILTFQDKYQLNLVELAAKTHQIWLNRREDDYCTRTSETSSSH